MGNGFFTVCGIVEINDKVLLVRHTYGTAKNRILCPGGYVVNSSSEEEMLVVNGMSYSDRNSSTANSAIIISVNEQDFTNPMFFQDGAEHLLKDADALCGMRFQQALERKAYQLANGKIPQQLYGDFCENKC